MGKDTTKKRPGSVIALLVLAAVQAAGAIGGGIGLVRDPVNRSSPKGCCWATWAQRG